MKNTNNNIQDIIKLAFGLEGDTPLNQSFMDNVMRYMQGNNQSQGVIANPTEIISPDTTLAQNNIMRANANYKATNNSFIKGMNMLGNGMVQFGMNGLANNYDLDSFGFGGNVTGNNVEVEGGEVGETKEGEVVNFKGPSHEQGGINTILPEGMDIFSNRISIDGVTLADRKKKRTKTKLTLEKLLEKQGDIVLENTHNRVSTNNKKHDDTDKSIQRVVRNIITPEKRKAAWGMDDYTSLMNKGVDGYQNNIGATGGDLLGLFGQLYTANKPMENVLEQRAGDTVNQNFFKDFGKDSMKKMDEMRAILGQNKEAQLSDLQLSQNAALSQNRNSSRGVNNMRAFDMITAMNVDKQKTNINNNYNNSLSQLLGNEANMLMNIDGTVMGAEQQRDDNDRRDRDNYYSQLSKAITNKGLGIQNMGKTVNNIKTNNDGDALVKQLTDLGYTRNEIEMFKKMQAKING